MGIYKGKKSKKKVRMKPHLGPSKSLIHTTGQEKKKDSRKKRKQSRKYTLDQENDQKRKSFWIIRNINQFYFQTLIIVYHLSIRPIRP